MKKHTEPFWSNCWLMAVRLYVTGRCRRFAIIRSNNGPFPHIVGLTGSGHILHFYFGGVEQNWFTLRVPIVFRGRIGGVRKKIKNRAYGGRVLIGRL